MALPVVRFSLNLFTGGLGVTLSSVRHIGKYSKIIYPWMNRRKPYWVDQKSDPLCNEDISEENQKFLANERQEYFSEKFSPVNFTAAANKPWLPMVTQRCGLIAVKLGIYPMWTKAGKLVNCTVLQVFLICDILTVIFCILLLMRFIINLTRDH